MWRISSYVPKPVRRRTSVSNFPNGFMDSSNSAFQKIPSVNVHLDYVIKAIRNTLHHDLSIKLPSLCLLNHFQSRQQRWWVYCFLSSSPSAPFGAGLASIKSQTSIVIIFYVNSIRSECRHSMNSKHQAMCQGWRGVCAQIAELPSESKDFHLL